jgi:hypothetical protein
MPGISEVITFMLALQGFGIDANPKAPSADAVLAYAVEDADVVLHVDVTAIGPRNYKALVALPDDPLVKANPDLLAMVKKVKANVEGVRGMSKAVTGLDPVNDLSSVTVFLDVVPDKEPTFLVVARGKIPSDFVKKLSTVSGGTTGDIDGRATVEVDAQTFVGTTKDGVLIVGPKSWVTPRVDDDWKKPARKKGSAWAAIAQRLDDKPFALAALKLDDKTAKWAAKEADEPFLADLITGHELAVLALHSDGVTFQWKDKTKAGLDRVAMLSDGVVEMTRAMHVAPRGFAKIFLAAIDSYKGKDKDADELIKHKGDILKLVEAYTGDGKFKVAVDKDAKAKSLTVRATGKSLSDVVPAAALLPAMGFLVFSRESSSSVQAMPPATAVPAKPAKPVTPAKKPATKKPAPKKTP